MREHGTGVLFITHDFGVVAEIADRVAVLRAGELVELGPMREVLRAPQHDYTKMLIAAVPSLTPRASRRGRRRRSSCAREGLEQDLRATRPGRRGEATSVAAATDVSFEIRRGETRRHRRRVGLGQVAPSRAASRG